MTNLPTTAGASRDASSRRAGCMARCRSSSHGMRPDGIVYVADSLIKHLIQPQIPGERCKDD